MCTPATLVPATDKLRTPEEHLGVLLEPDARRLRAALHTDHTTALRDVPLLDSDVATLRADLRQRLHLSAPVVMTGHQAEFSHAGVLAKTIAVRALAAADATAAFVLADSDTPKLPYLGVPCRREGRLSRELVALPGIDAQLPTEDQPATPRQAWADCFEQVRAVHLVPAERTLLPQFIDGWLSAAEEQVDFCDALTRGRLATETALGITDVRQLRMSELAKTPAFRALVAHLIREARRAAQCYNDAQTAYRRRHRVRNAQRPVPPLVCEQERVELPLWAYRAGEPRRRMFAGSVPGGVALLAGEVPMATFALDDLGRADDHAWWDELTRGGWRVRPRALLLSGFLRLMAADLFIHGIGGAKYDEVTESFLQAWLGARLPPGGCVSATLLLPLADALPDGIDLRTARHAARDVRFNPQRYLPAAPAALLAERARLIERSEELRATRRDDRSARREVWEQLNAINAELVASDGGTTRADLDAAVARARELAAQRAVAQDREFFYVLHPADSLRALVERVEDRCAD